MKPITKLGIHKIKALGLENTRESGNVKMTSSEGDRYDFLPVVKINGSENPKNAIVFLTDCAESKLEYLNLGNDYDDKWKKYPVANIVIAKNSISRIPLIVKMGYDPIGWQDGDGILEFKSSNASAKLKFIDNDDSDYGNDKHQYDLKDAEYGDELVLEIDARALARGTRFSIYVYASDDGDGLGKTSKRKGICGKLNLKVVEKDVFLREEFNKGVTENKVLVGVDHVCFRVADKQVSKVLNNDKLVLSNYSGKNSYDRAQDFKSKGIIKEEKIFDQFIIKGGGNTEPKEFASGKEKVISSYFSESIKGKMGYHYYYFSIIKGDHVLTLMIDNTIPCNVKFKTFDQTEIYSEKSFKEIDQEILRLSNWIWNYMLKTTGKVHNTELAVWKIQR